MITNLLDIHFPKSNKLHRIFSRNTVEVSYCCSENLLRITKTHIKKVINEERTPKIPMQSIVEIRTISQLMVTAKQVILYTNALPQPPLIHTKYT